MKVINFRSQPKNNFFAPEWNYFIAETLAENIDFNQFSIFLLNKRNEILNLPDNDNTEAAHTGLINSTTSRWKKYNVLSWEDKNIYLFKDNIIKAHNEFLKFLKLNLPNELYVQCWLNVMKKGEKINAHIHSFHPNTYLGGHLCVQVKDTCTYYMTSMNQVNNPEIYSSENEIGKLTLFQNCVPHFTDIHNDDKERITLAFDLSLQKADNYIRLI